MDGDWRTVGEDQCDRCNLIGSSKNMRRNRLGAFRGNKAHSNMWQGFRLHHFEQFFQYRNDIDVPVFEDVWAYRNREHGIYTYNVIAAEWRGGVIADNQYGFVLRREDRILVKDFEIKGSTQAFKDHTVTRDLKLCSHSSRHQYGIQMGTTIWRTGSSDPGLGLRLKNVSFEDFDHDFASYNCASSLVSADCTAYRS